MNDTLNLNKYLSDKDISDYNKEFDAGGLVYNIEVYGLPDIDIDIDIDWGGLDGDID